MIGGTTMRSFILACLTAIVLAGIGAVVLNYVQEPASSAFRTESART